MDDSDGCLVYLVLGVLLTGVVMFILYVIAHLVIALGGTMGVAGIAYGCGQACMNYSRAFKHNVIDSNRV